MNKTYTLAYKSWIGSYIEQDFNELKEALRHGVAVLLYPRNFKLSESNGLITLKFFRNRKKEHKYRFSLRPEHVNLLFKQLIAPDFKYMSVVDNSLKSAQIEESGTGNEVSSERMTVMMLEDFDFDPFVNPSQRV